MRQGVSIERRVPNNDPTLMKSIVWRYGSIRSFVTKKELMFGNDEIGSHIADEIASAADTTIDVQWPVVASVYHGQMKEGRSGPWLGRVHEWNLGERKKRGVGRW